MLGASRMATDLIPLANARGFSPDICSYLTSDIGSYLKGESPLQKMKLSGPPKADVLVFNTNQCRDVKDWFQFYAREWNVPCLGVHTPRVDRRGGRARWSTTWPGRSRRWSSRWKQVAGAKLDLDRLREVIDLSRQMHGALEGGAGDGRPTCPRRSRSSTARSRWARPWCCAALQEAVDYYRAAAGRAEAAGGRRRGGRRRASGSASTGKACRSGASSATSSTQFLELQTCVVASTYCNSWIFEALDPADPFRSMARAYSSIFICRSRRPQGGVHRADGRASSRSTASSTTTPRPARTTRTAATRCRSGCSKKLGKPYLVDQRRPERPAAVLRRADADEHRGVRRAACCRGETSDGLLLRHRHRRFGGQAGDHRRPSGGSWPRRCAARASTTPQTAEPLPGRGAGRGRTAPRRRSRGRSPPATAATTCPGPAAR